MERETKTAAIRSLYIIGIPIDPKIWRNILRKEVIQPQVPLRLPCYDFTPVADPTVVGCLLAVSAPASGKTNSHGTLAGDYGGVTGGVAAGYGVGANALVGGSSDSIVLQPLSVEGIKGINLAAGIGILSLRAR